MNRIRLLPEQVANQIAAGEVVERPASVVKELIENALDAQARRLTVEIQAGGRALIRITDDGVGMNRDDALLCLERHATSKIRTAHDLASIATMGFRGEAIPSIASVSKMIITTAERREPADQAATHDPPPAAHGTQVIIHGGKLLDVKEAGAPAGTAIEVRQLFYNLPARRKFLRSEETERAHIQHYLTLVALAYPEVALTFVEDGKVVWQLPPLAVGPQPKERLDPVHSRLRQVYGNVHLIPLLAAGTIDDPDPQADPAENSMTLWGFIGAPGVSRATRQDQNLFVNRRPIESRGLNHALIEGYHTALMKGRFPICCLFLELAPAEVDVNIHPAKSEVRFRRERDVRDFFGRAVRQALLRFHASSVTQPPADPAPPAVPEPALSAEIERTPAVNLESLRLDPPIFAAGHGLGLVMPRVPAPAATPVPHHHVPASAVFSGQTPVPAESEPVPLLAVPLRLIGVCARLYVLFESDRGLVLMDQHAAHERVLYEQMLDRLEAGGTPSQRLLLPETIELSAQDAQFLRDHLATLSRMGVGLSEFGDRTFLLDSIPPFVRAQDARRFVVEVIDELKASGASVNSWRLGEQMVAKTVCRHAVKANDALGPPELEKLVEQLRRCAMPYTCPHGRPTLIEISARDLERKFGRVV